jgi:hypothetical protein
VVLARTWRDAAAEPERATAWFTSATNPVRSAVEAPPSDDGDPPCRAIGPFGILAIRNSLPKARARQLPISAAQPRQVIFRETYFTIGNNNFDYVAVDSIKFFYKITKWMLYGVVHTGTSHDAKLDIYIRNKSEPLKIRYHRDWVKSLSTSTTHKKASADDLLVCYQELAIKTFESRASRYLGQLQNRRNFTCDDKSFSEDGEVTLLNGKFLFNIKDVTPLRFPFQVDCVPKGSRLDAKIQNRKNGPSPLSLKIAGGHVIRTEVDRDVFFFLLNRVFGIAWP